MKFLVEIPPERVEEIHRENSCQGIYPFDEVWISNEVDERMSFRIKPYKIRFACYGMQYGRVVGYKTEQRRDEVYKQLQDWMAEIYKCSINKYYLKIFADMGGDIIFRFPEE